MDCRSVPYHGLCTKARISNYINTRTGRGQSARDFFRRLGRACLVLCRTLLPHVSLDISCPFKQQGSAFHDIKFLQADKESSMTRLVGRRIGWSKAVSTWTGDTSNGSCFTPELSYKLWYHYHPLLSLIHMTAGAGVSFSLLRVKVRRSARRRPPSEYRPKPTSSTSIARLGES